MFVCWQSKRRMKSVKSKRGGESLVGWKRSLVVLTLTIQSTKFINRSKDIVYSFCSLFRGVASWGHADYYMCIYDRPGWHAIPLSSLLTYSSASLSPSFSSLLRTLYFFPKSWIGHISSPLAWLEQLKSSQLENYVHSVIQTSIR